MKTPAASPTALRISVLPPVGPEAPLGSEPLSDVEAWQIVQAIKPRFAEFASQYDTKKYWPDVYERVSRAFLEPKQVGPATLREALLWKYGHLGKPAIPPAHERLISQLQRGWPGSAVAFTTTADSFGALDREFGGKTRFVTVAFLLHLLRPREVPIIDQHNFRAVNALMVEVRPSWAIRRTPSRYGDVVLIASFMTAVIEAWSQRESNTAPSRRDLDKFLMMYGKAIKARSNKRLHLSAAAVVSSGIEASASGRRK